MNPMTDMGTFWRDLYKARVDDYARKVAEYAKLASSAFPATEIPKLDIEAPEIPPPPEWLGAQDKQR